MLESEDYELFGIETMNDVAGKKIGKGLGNQRTKDTLAYCMELYATHLEQKTASKTDEKKTEEETTKSQVFETGLHGVIKKQPKDMTDEEFTQYEKGLKADYYAKK